MEGEERQEKVASFRDDVEARLNALESSQAAAAEADRARIGAAGADPEGNSLVGLVRTCEARVSQVETGIAENTSAVLRLTGLVESQAATIAQLTNEVKALRPPQ
jgi:uncharacterized coiled-coil protein SlyX